MQKARFSLTGKVIAIVLCLSLSLGIFSPLGTLAATFDQADIDKNRDGVVDYVVIGSYDAAGYGFSDYGAEKFGYGSVPSGSYADILKKKIEATGKRVNITQLSISGMRAEELLYILDSDYDGDIYTEETFLGENGVFAQIGGISALRESYRNAIRSAELITLDIGFDNFAAYALSYIFENKYAPDFTVFDEGMQRSVNEIKARFEDVLGGYAADSESPELVELLNRAINGLTYALVGYCSAFDAVLSEIYSINSQAEIAVCDIRNPITGLDIIIGDFGIPVSVEFVYGIIVDLANVYMATLTEYKDMFYFAYLGSDIAKSGEDTSLGNSGSDFSDLVGLKYSPDEVALLDEDGHKAMADKLFYAIENGRTGFSVMAEDMNEIYSYLLDYFNRETLIDLEYTFKPYYTCDKNSHYVALGDGSAAGSVSYPSRLYDKLNRDFGLKKNSFKNLANVNKSNAKLDETPDETLAALKIGGDILNEVKRADLITLSYTNLETARFMLNKNSKTDWADLFGEEAVSEIEEIISLLREEIIASGLSSSVADILLPLAEKYAYAYLKRAISYIELVEYIREINPDALVVIVGTYNEMENFEITYEDTEIQFGNLMQYLIDAANLETLVLSALSENTAYVASPEVETVFESKGKATKWTIDTLLQFVPLLNQFGNMMNSNEFLPSENGHKAIADTVLGIIEIVGEHECEYDNACDNRCNICMDKRTIKHEYSAICDTKCNICGALRRAEAHEYVSDCDSVCGVCGETRTAVEHSYSSDCDTSCNLCASSRESSVSHTFGERTSTENGKVRKCTKCGYTEPADGLSAGAIVAVSVGGVVVVGGGGFALFWFVIKKKTLIDFLLLFVKK